MPGLQSRLAKGKFRKIEAPRPVPTPVSSKPAPAGTPTNAPEGSVDAYAIFDETGLDTFETALSRYASLGEKIKALEEKRDDLKAQITGIVAASGHKTIRGEEYQATYVAGASRSRLDAKL